MDSLQKRIRFGVTLAVLAAVYFGAAAFERPARVFTFVAAAAAGAFMSATIGLASLLATGNANWSDIGPTWLTWWLGDVAGALIVTPLIVVWARPDPGPNRANWY